MDFGAIATTRLYSPIGSYDFMVVFFDAACTSDYFRELAFKCCLKSPKFHCTNMSLSTADSGASWIQLNMACLGG